MGWSSVIQEIRFERTEFAHKEMVEAEVDAQHQAYSEHTVGTPFACMLFSPIFT